MKMLSLTQVKEILEYFHGTVAYYLKAGNISYGEKCKYELVSSNLVKPFVESQGEQGQEEFVFKIDEELFVKVICYSDSYGSDSYSTVRFVEPIQKTITAYEPV
jgi:hypothetical protein